jgi:hypothetical protein
MTQEKQLEYLTTTTDKGNKRLDFRFALSWWTSREVEWHAHRSGVLVTIVLLSTPSVCRPSRHHHAGTRRLIKHFGRCATGKVRKYVLTMQEHGFSSPNGCGAEEQCAHVRDVLHRTLPEAVGFTRDWTGLSELSARKDVSTGRPYYRSSYRIVLSDFVSVPARRGNTLARFRIQIISPFSPCFQFWYFDQRHERFSLQVLLGLVDPLPTGPCLWPIRTQNLQRSLLHEQN